MTGQQIAIFGLGRSGLGVAKAALTKGAHPHIYDQSSEASISKKDLLDEARSLGVPVTLDWNGDLEPGTDVLVVNPAVPTNHPFLTRLPGPDSLLPEIIGEIEFAYRISHAPIVAITGTNGKSTTTVMTYLCLKACGVDAVLCGNIYGSGYPEISLTEAALLSTPDQVLVAEVSSFQLETIKDFRPIVAGITNIWPDHLDRYGGSMAAYAAAKHRLFMNMRGGDYVVVRANDPAVVPPGGSRSAYRPRGLRRPPGTQEAGDLPTVLTFGSTGEHGRVEERDLVIMGQKIPIDELPFREPHNLQNACMAGLMAWAALARRASRLGIVDCGSGEVGTQAGEPLPLSDPHIRSTIHNPQSTIPSTPCLANGLKSFHGLAHRMELVGERGGVRVINNSMCTNPDAVIKSVQAVRDRTHILMGGVNKGLDFGPLRHYLANHRHRVYLYGRNGDELREMLDTALPIYETLQDAFKAAAESATQGEIIMLAPGCASTDSFKDFRDRGNVFKAIATDWLRS